MRINSKMPSLSFRDGDESLQVHYDNRGEPFREGVTFTFTVDGDLVGVMLNAVEVRQLRDRLSEFIAESAPAKPPKKREKLGDASRRRDRQQAIAEFVVEDLFTSGIDGEVANRLVLEMSGKTRDGGGWSQAGATAAVCRLLKQLGVDRIEHD